MAHIDELSVNLGLPQSPLTQNQELYTELKKIYNAINTVARALDLYTGVVGETESYYSQADTGRVTFGLNTKIYLEAGEAIAQGNTVQIKSDGKAWKATGSTCIGFSTAAGTVPAGGFIEAQLVGLYPPFAAGSLIPGNKYYQSSTSGSIGATGTQVVGFAISDTQLFFNPQL